MDTVSSGHNESAQPAEKAVSDFIGVFEEPGANENAGSNPNTKQLVGLKAHSKADTEYGNRTGVYSGG